MTCHTETCGEMLRALTGVLLVAFSLTAAAPAAAQLRAGLDGDGAREATMTSPVLERGASPDAAVPAEPRFGRVPAPLVRGVDTAEDRHEGAVEASRLARHTAFPGVRAIRGGASVYDAAPRYAVLCSYRL